MKGEKKEVMMKKLIKARKEANKALYIIPNQRSNITSDGKCKQHADFFLKEERGRTGGGGAGEDFFFFITSLAATQNPLFNPKTSS